MKTYDGSIPQRTEVVATITDNTGKRPQSPHPPPFGLPKYPIPNYKPPILNLPKFTRTTQKPTKATEEYLEDTTVPELISSTSNPPKTPEDVPNVDSTSANNDGHEVNEPKETSEESTNKNEVPFTVISLVAIGGLIVVVVGVIVFVWKKNSSRNSKSKKDDMVRFIFKINFFAFIFNYNVNSITLLLKITYIFTIL